MSTSEAQKRASKKYYEKNKADIMKKNNQYTKINSKLITVPKNIHAELTELARQYNMPIAQLISKLVCYCKKVKDIII